MIPAEAMQRYVQMTGDRILQCLDDLSPDELVARPQGLAPVLWQVGHVAVTDALLLQRSGEALAIPEGFEAGFARGSGDGPYPPTDAVRVFFDRVQQAVLALAGGDPQRPAVSPRGTYHTVGEGIVYNLYHRGYHHGKLMTLRALLQKPRLLG